MEKKDINNLQEAYMSIYESQDIDEEINIASEYFYEMGLNEYGVDILIEELGLEDFSEFVEEINEQYFLDEATRTRLMKSADKKNKILIGPKGSRPQSTTKAAIKKHGGTIRGGISGGVSNTIMKKALSKAKDTQPASTSSPEKTKRGIAGRLGAALGGAVKRAKQDIETVKKTAQTAKKAFDTGVEGLNRASDSRLARQARVATKKGFRRQEKAMTAAGGTLGRAAARSSVVRDTFRAGQRLGRAVRGEEYDYVIEYLIDGGYVDTVESAEAIIDCISEEWKEEILMEGFKRMNRSKIEKQAKKLGGDRGDILRIVADKMDTPQERRYSTSQARKNRAGAGSQYRKAKELQARDDAKADIEKYGLH